MASLVNKQSLGIAALSSIPLLLPTDWGAHWMYPITLPWIVYWAHILITKGMPRWYASFLVWIPAIGMITWQRAILHLDLRYLKASEGILHPLKLMWQSQQNGWMLLLGATIGAWFMNKRMSFALILVALGNGFTEIALTNILRGLHNGEWTQTSLWLISIEIIRWVPLYFLWQRFDTRRNTLPYLGSTSVFLSIVTLWLSGPLVSLLLWFQPNSKPTIPVPETTLSLGMTIPIANPLDIHFEKQLNAQGTTQLPKASWWCRPEAKPNWETQHRAFAAIELDRASTLETIQPHIYEIFRRGITQVGMLSKSTKSHWYPPLAKHLEYPGIHWYVSPPPTSSRMVSLKQDQSLEWIRNGNDHCALQASWQTSIQHLTDTYGTLVDQHQCQPPIFLSISHNPNSESEWNPPIPCPY